MVNGIQTGSIIDISDRRDEGIQAGQMMDGRKKTNEGIQSGQMTDKRKRLNGDISLCFFDANSQCNRYQVSVNRELGRGRTCICYDVDVKLQQKVTHKMILKQFYPLLYSQKQNRLLTLNRTLGTLELEHCGPVTVGQVEHLKDCFLNSFELQNGLANNEATAGITVKAWIQGWPDDVESGYTMYALYDRNPGKNLSEIQQGSMIEKTEIMVRLLEALEKLHGQNVLYVDLKPENILLTKEHQIMFFDFDSAVMMDAMEQVNTISCTPAWSAPELCQMIGGKYRISPTFEQNKWFRLNPAVDLYSAGQIFYWMITGHPLETVQCPARPEEIFDSEVVREELEEGFRNHFSGVYQGNVKQQILRILGRSICTRSAFRYRDASEMLEDTRKFLEILKINNNFIDREPDLLCELSASFVLYENPLFDYCYRNSGTGKKEIQVILAASNKWGKDAWDWSPVRNELFSQIFSCAQMLDTEIKICFLSKDAENYCRKLMENCPELRNYVDIEVDGHHLSHPEISLAAIKFLTTENTTAAILEQLEKNPFPAYILFVDRNGEWNHNQAEQICVQISTENSIIDREHCFLGYADERGEETEIQKMEPKGPAWLTICRFGMNRYYSREELLLQKQITELSAAFHTYTMRHRYKNVSVNEVVRDLNSNSYNLHSSQRLVISLPYKLASFALGMKEVLEKPEILSSLLAEEENMNSMVYLEHVSWTCFMICQGYRCPDNDELRRYAYKGGIGHHFRKKRLHPGLCLGERNSGCMLEHMEHNQWLEEAREHLDHYDLLDQCSLKLHQLCAERREYSLHFLPALWDQFEVELSLEPSGASLLPQAEQLRLAADHLIQDRISGTEWKVIGREFYEALCGENLTNESLFQIYSLINNYMQPVCEFHNYDDFKSYDKHLVEALIDILRNAGEMRKGVRNEKV